MPHPGPQFTCPVRSKSDLRGYPQEHFNWKQRGGTRNRRTLRLPPWESKPPIGRKVTLHNCGCQQRNSRSLYGVGALRVIGVTASTPHFSLSLRQQGCIFHPVLFSPRQTLEGIGGGAF